MIFSFASINNNKQATGIILCMDYVHNIKGVYAELSMYVYMYSL